MKKKLTFLAIVIIIGLVGFAFDRIMPPSIANAASDPQTGLASSADTANPETDSIPLTRSAPIVFLVTGLVCALFGIIAVSPLLVDDSASLRSGDDRGEL